MQRIRYRNVGARSTLAEESEIISREMEHALWGPITALVGELEGSDSLGQVKVDGRSLCPTPQ
jgi:hypothetical protein